MKEMEKIYCNAKFLILSMLCLFSACSDQMISGPDEEIIPGTGDKTIPIVINMKDLFEVSTYAPTNYPGIDVPGSTLEDQINDLTVYIFDNAFVCEKIVNVVSSNSAGPVMVTTGNKNFVAIANAAGRIVLPTSESATDYSDLLKMVTDASTALPTSPFLMTGKRLNVPLPNELPSASPYNVDINVERACAKVTLKVRKSGLASSHDITLTEVVLSQGANRVALLETPNPNTLPTYSLSGSSVLFDVFNTSNVMTGANSGAIPNPSDGFCVVRDSFYTYESLCGHNKNEAVKITLKTYVGPVVTNTRTAEFYLGAYSTTPGDTTYNVIRNHWYDVTVDIIKPGMDSIYVDVKASPWNVADTIKSLAGSGGVFATATPFKLVKNYTNAEISSAAIDKHSKGASWIDIKVTNGVSWGLTLRDPSAPRNQGVQASVNGGSWQNFPITGTGNDGLQRVYIYRPYVENSEPNLGPSLYATVGGEYKQDFVIQPRDTTPIPTNSYILRPQLSGTPTNESRAYIPLAGVYKYWEDYLLANGDSIPNLGDISAELIWKDRAGTVVKNISVINKDKRDSAYIYAEAGATEGNAVIAMKVNNITYWSFHLWVTEYNPYEAAGQKLYVSSKNVFMDRDLGAMANVSDPSGEARGLFYQFGRKDPFPRGENWGNTFIWFNPSARQTNISSTTSLPHVTTTRPKLAIPTVIRNPMTFYSVPSWPIQIENPNLWSSVGGNKTAFDPCPEGWRVPVQVSSGDASSPWRGLNLSTLAATLGYYPLNGHIGNNGILGNSGSRAYFWSSWPGTAAGLTGLLVESSSMSTAPSPLIDKHTGASVRCVVDLKYLLDTGGGRFGSSGQNLINNLR